ncbi:MAG: hypothetical protein WC464_01980 [Bdellovibrionales bacterium]
MGQSINDAVERARSLFHTPPKDWPSLVKPFNDLTSAYNLTGKKEPEGGMFGERLSQQDLFSNLVLFAELEGKCCNHPVYGFANLPKPVGENIKKIFKRVTDNKSVYCDNKTHFKRHLTCC